MNDLTKETWAALTDEEKTKELQRIIPGADYKKYKEHYERLKELGKEDMFLFENPCVIFKLIDPVMASELVALLYAKGEKLNQIPVFGYRAMEVTFDKSTLMNFSDSEKEILTQAMDILNKRIYNKQEEDGMF